MMKKRFIKTVNEGAEGSKEYYRYKINRLEDKIMGALFGLAIGDAMAATTEFMREYQVKAE